MFNDLIVNGFKVRNFPTCQCAFERLQTPLPSVIIIRIQKLFKKVKYSINYQIVMKIL